MKSTLYFFSSLFLLTACASSKQNNWLNEHNASLSKIKLPSLSAEEKLDIVMESYVGMMHQSLDFLNPKKGVAFAEKYNEQHKNLIISVLEEVNEDYSSLSKPQKISRGISMMGKSYSKEFVELFPRFQKKYKFLNSITDVNKRIKEAVLEKLGL